MFARSLGEFGATIIVAGNIPWVTQTLPLAIYDYSLASTDNNMALMLCGVSIFISLIMVMLSVWVTKRMSKKIN